jgi:trehalose 6-phosphate phosphatase
LAGNESSVVYVGDDEGDVPAFGALDVLEGSGLSVVRVAVGSPELPQLLEALADIVVDGPLGVVEFLTG